MELFEFLANVLHRGQVRVLVAVELHGDGLAVHQGDIDRRGDDAAPNRALALEHVQALERELGD